MTTIRPATVADVPALLDMGQLFHAETYADRIPWRRELWEAQGFGLIENPQGLILIAEDAGQPAGMLGLVGMRHPMTGEHVVAELFWFVRPESRSRTGLQLLRAGEQWARAQQAVRLLMIAPDDRIATLYDRLGYTLTERSYEAVL